MSEKERYVKAVIDVIRINNDDIILTSDPENPGETEPTEESIEEPTGYY